MTEYWFAPDGDDEPTMWRYDRTGPIRWDPRAVLRRCDNPEVFDYLESLPDSSWTPPEDS